MTADPSTTCPRCGRTIDVSGYCGHCHDYTGDQSFTARLRAALRREDQT